MKEEKKEEKVNINLQKVEKSLNQITISNHLNQIESFAEYILKSNLAPESFTTAKDVAVALIMGKELGFQAMTSLNNINIINGKPGLAVNAYTSKMIKSGIIYNILKELETEIIFKDNNNIEYRQKEVVENPDLFHIFSGKKEDKDYNEKMEAAKKAKESGKTIISIKSIDKFTEIQFKRVIKLINGVYETMVITHRIYVSEIEALGLLSRDQWKKQLRTMLRTRVLTAGARLIAPDEFMGYYTDVELKDTNGDNYLFNEEKQIIEEVDYEEIKKEN